MNLFYVFFEYRADQKAIININQTVNFLICYLIISTVSIEVTELVKK